MCLSHIDLLAFVKMSSNSEIQPVTEVMDEVVHEVRENSVGEYVGQTKWFSDVRGYGFITVQNGEYKGKDIFVHHTGVKPLNSNYKTLKKGEYVNFNITTGDNGLQAVDVTGIGGGTLMCDIIPMRRVSNPTDNMPSTSGRPFPPPPPRPYSRNGNSRSKRPTEPEY